MKKQTTPTPLPWFYDGVLAAWPICFGYIPIGLAFGVLADQAGIPTWAVVMMSALVFAGSAQFVCVAMLTASASPVAIIFTTFIINLRHFLMSSALAVYLRGTNRLFLSVFAYGVTDESFAVNMTRFKGGKWDQMRAVTVNQTANLCWITATGCGSFLGQFIPLGAFGTGYALPAMFLALLIFQLHDVLTAVTGLISVMVAVLWYTCIPGDSYILGASITAATAGFFLKRYREKRR